MPRLQHLTDQELSLRMREGDRLAFTELYDRYAAILYRHAYRWLQDRETVRDVIQELFTLVWNKRETLLIGQNPSGYFYTAIRREVLRRIRQQGKLAGRLASLADYAEEAENTTDFLVREKQLKALIDREVGELPEKMREVFELSRYEHFSYAEIALKLGISEQTVRTHIKKALRILRGKLGLLAYIYLLLK